MEKKKNILIIMLSIIILLLCFVIGVIIGSKYLGDKDDIINNIEEEINKNNKNQIEIGSLGTATKEIDACATNFKIESDNTISIFDNQINNKKLNIQQINEKVIGLKLSTNCGCEVELVALTESGNVFVALNNNIYYEPSVKFIKVNIDKEVVGLDVIKDETLSTCYEEKIVIITSDGNKQILHTDRLKEESIRLEDYESYQNNIKE